MDTGHYAVCRSKLSTGAVTLLRVLLLNIHHTAMAVEDLESSIESFRSQYGVEPLYRERIESQGVEEAMFPLGGSHVQLLQPLDGDTPVGRFLKRHGEGLHHIAFQVADIETALTHLESQGARLIDKKPRLGGGGHRIAFIHPQSFAGALIELVEVE